ncbi:YegP family protein [Pectobacterium polaris]|uniref:YegP family protein n=1 Tax=Pectobacterium polaris TaxID=2042057 RepID=UPI000EA3DD81|nr:YegP family protein [Pectobacterium polaris]RJL19356.1 DUF1508 domain-containing protein [Pectobacterium polaris]
MGYYELKKSPTATQQQYYWVLKASNHEVIATSEMYSSKQAAQNGIRSVQVNGTTTNIRDESGGLSSILGLR